MLICVTLIKNFIPICGSAWGLRLVSNPGGCGARIAAVFNKMNKYDSLNQNGVRVGDRIITVNGMSVEGISYLHVYDMLQAATEVHMFVRPDPTPLLAGAENGAPILTPDLVAVRRIVTLTKEKDISTLRSNCGLDGDGIPRITGVPSRWHACVDEGDVIVAINGSPVEVHLLCVPCETTPLYISIKWHGCAAMGSNQLDVVVLFMDT